MTRMAFTAYLCAGCFSAVNAGSSLTIPFPDTSLIDTNQNQAYNSKPTAFELVIPAQKPLPNFYKLASVHFITDRYQQLKFGNLIFDCNEGWHLENNACIPNTCDSFPYVKEPIDICTDSETCLSGDNNKYACNICKDGWDKNPLKEGSCVEHSCDPALYPYSIRPDNGAGTITSCKSGNSEYYGYSNCFEGWKLNSGKCIPNDCSGFPYQKVPDEVAGFVSDEVCLSGYDSYYKYASCNKGWELAEGKCNLRLCDNAVYPNTDCPPNATCNACFSGDNVKYSEPSCNSGFELKDGACIESCKYTNTSTPSNCASALSCLKGETTYYGCQSCQNGWFVNSSFGCSPNVCTGYDTSGSYCNLKYGTYAKSCQSGNTTYCSYSSCNTPYTKKNGNCLCSGSYAVTETGWKFECSQSRGELINECSDAEGTHCNFSSCNPRIAKYQSGRCDCLTSTDVPSQYVRSVYDLGWKRACTSYRLADGSEKELCSIDETDYYEIGCGVSYYNYHFSCPDGYYPHCDTKRMCGCVRKLNNGSLAQFVSAGYQTYSSGSSLHFTEERSFYNDDVTHASCYNYCQSISGRITSNAKYFSGNSKYNGNSVYLLHDGTWCKGSGLSLSPVWLYEYGATANKTNPTYHCYSCDHEHSGSITSKLRCVCDIKTYVFNCGTGMIKAPGSNIYGYTCLCDTAKYPYTSQPSTTNGTIITCSDEDGTRHYGYSQCLNGLALNNGKCE